MKNCDSCTRLLSGNICKLDNAIIDNIYDTVCDNFTTIYPWTMENFKESFNSTINYIVIKRMSNGYYIVDRIRKNKKCFYMEGNYKKVIIPPFKRGTLFAEKGDIININKEQDYQFIGKLAEGVL